VIVLLPPSESKSAPPRRGRPVALDTLSFPSLNPLREKVLDALAATSAAPDALAQLGVGRSLAAEVERNTRLRALAAQPASSVYTGVLYDALHWPSLSPGGKRRGATRLVVVSALWGALRPGDRVPSYRLSMDVDLPGVGPLATAWRAVLDDELSAAAGERGLVVDCRSSTYAAAWMPSGPLAERTVAVRVLKQGPTGRTVVSHMAKHTRGEVARHLLEAGADPMSPKRLAAVLAQRWSGEHGAVELVAPTRAGRPWAVDVVLP
jgi:hypothetical protein